MSECATTLAPGIAAFNEIVDAGKLCELAGFDSILLQLCKAGTGTVAAEALLPVDVKVLCVVYCCCKEDYRVGADGRALYDNCASETIGAADQMMGWRSRYKSQLSYNMRATPLVPLVEKSTSGGLGTTPIPTTSGGRTHMKNRIEKENPGQTPLYGKDTRRPDVVIVRDSTRAPTLDNIVRVVDFKFGKEGYKEGQEESYRVMGGGRLPLTIDDNECDCGDQKRRQSELELVAAADAYKQAQPSALKKVGLGVVVGLGAVATVALFLLPLDGPFGEAVAGTLTASASAGMRTVAMNATMAAGARGAAAQMMRRLFQTGARAVPAF
jgi:hypothetical protein